MIYVMQSRLFQIHRAVRALGRCVTSLAVLAVINVGCSERPDPTGSVHGLVSYNGMPVKQGTVVFENSSAGIFAAGQLSGDGEYRIAGLKPLEYVVSVLPPQRELPNENSGFDGTGSLPVKPTANPRDIPVKYHSSHESPLRHKVLEGDSEYIIEMTP